MTARDTNFLEFLQTHLNYVKREGFKIYLLGTVHYTNFGKDFIKIEASPLDQDKFDKIRQISWSNENYYSTTVRSGDDYYFKSEEDRKEFIYGLEKDFTEIENNITLFISVMKVAYPDLIIINKCKRYRVPLDFKYKNSSRRSDEWIEAKPMQLWHPTVVKVGDWSFIDHISEETDKLIMEDWDKGIEQLKIIGK